MTDLRLKISDMMEDHALPTPGNMDAFITEAVKAHAAHNEAVIRAMGLTEADAKTKELIMNQQGEVIGVKDKELEPETFTIAESNVIRALNMVENNVSDEFMIDALTALIDERIENAKGPRNSIYCDPATFEAIKKQAAEEEARDKVKFGNEDVRQGVPPKSLGQVAYEAYIGIGAVDFPWDGEESPQSWQAAADAVVKANNERSASTGPGIDFYAEKAKMEELLERASVIIMANTIAEKFWLADYEAWKAGR